MAALTLPCKRSAWCEIYQTKEEDAQEEEQTDRLKDTPRYVNSHVNSYSSQARESEAEQDFRLRSFCWLLSMPSVPAEARGKLLLDNFPICDIPGDNVIDSGLHALESRGICIGVNGGEHQNIWYLLIEDLCHLAKIFLSFGVIQCI